MSQPDEGLGERPVCAYCYEYHPKRGCDITEAEPDRTCYGCEGDGLCHYDDALPGEPCDSCGGSGVRPATSPSVTLRASASLTTESAEPAGRK